MATIQKTIYQLLISGEVITTWKGNKLASTVDTRKAISDLRAKGVKISDRWVKSGRKKWKEFYITPENR